MWKGESMSEQRLSLGSFQGCVDERLRAWQQQDVARRVWAKDPTLWSTEPLPELADRLGWLDLPAAMPAEADPLASFARDVRQAGFSQVVLLGMGGSSLAAEVFERTIGPAAGWPALSVLDSTHPAAVAAVRRTTDLLSTLFVVSSKSGTTSETMACLRYFWHELASRTRAPGDHFVAITDPGTPLERLALDRRFRRIFSGRPDVGGRYSALSVFGLVPAALMGIDLRELARRALAESHGCGAAVPADANPALALGAAMGELASGGRDKLTFLVPPSLTALPGWIEQLVAESTGKQGRGIIPIADELLREPHEYGDDRLFVSLQYKKARDPQLDRALSELRLAGRPVIEIVLDDEQSAAGEFFRWELATAAAAIVLGVHPFDQPDVQLAKDLARRAMEGREQDSRASAVPEAEVSAGEAGLKRAADAWLAGADPRAYVAIQAYLQPTATMSEGLVRLREVIAARTRIATTVGYGPRLLHSTGQLHKGGPSTGLFLQLSDEPAQDVAVPETSYTFGQLIRAQAVGDLGALKQRARRVLRVNLGRDAEDGVQRVVDALLG